MCSWKCSTPFLLSLTEIEKTISEAPGLSANSRRTYLHAMRRFLRCTSSDGIDPSSPLAFCQAISDPPRALASLEACIPAKNKLYTLSTTIGCLLSILKHTRLKYISSSSSEISSDCLLPSSSSTLVSSNISPIFIEWHSIYSSIKDQIRLLEEGNVPNSERKLAAASLTWSHVLAKTTELRNHAWKLRSKSSRSVSHAAHGENDYAMRQAFMDSLMSSFYSDLEPRRQSDYFRLRVFRNISEIPDSESDPDATFVYIPKSTRSLSESYIEIRKFKSSRHHGTWHTVLPAPLRKDLYESLEIQPREFVFVPASSSSSSSSSYRTVNAFTHAHNRKLSKWFGSHVTNNSLRHARASHAYQDRDLSISERTKIATAMGHTRDVHERYAYVH